METNKEHYKQKSMGEAGNALIYVLIAIALFAALSFTLSRQTDTGEAGTLADERAELYATQIISYAAQAKSAVDQMIFSGARINDLDFMDPSDANFNTGTVKARTNRVYHPEGGGLVKGRLPEEAIAQSTTDPLAGWYMGRFNNVEWTDTAGEDVILTAYQISRAVCEKINEKITDSSSIPSITVAERGLFIDDSFHSGSNSDFLTQITPHCADCDGRGSMCVGRGGRYLFYTIIADQ